MGLAANTCRGVYIRRLSIWVWLGLVANTCRGVYQEVVSIWFWLGLAVTTGRCVGLCKYGSSWVSQLIHAEVYTRRLC